MTETDLAALLLRGTLGTVMVAHGWNHLFGAGGVAGTARWFGSMGLRPPRVQALASGITEIGVGVCLLLGLLTTFQCAAVVGVMLVAGVTAHRRNGFFIFRPGQGWEYVAVLALAAATLAVLGAGDLAADRVIGIGDDLDGGLGLGLSIGLGSVGAGGLLLTCWRPLPQSPG
ncbi:DoxX family protein [Sporichthya brevicatena]|uniref:DoxX family protein n=1 Tax=Sporichthya brevicatena TaxID=171442 RepID=A0ABN1GJ68_9ACTN